MSKKGKLPSVPKTNKYMFTLRGTNLAEDICNDVFVKSCHNTDVFWMVGMTYNILVTRFIFLTWILVINLGTQTRTDLINIGIFDLDVVKYHIRA